MGTRGLMAFAHDGKVKAMYNHYDSYPSGLGKDIADWVRGLPEDLSEEIALFDRLEAVDEDVDPTEDQKLALLRYFNPRVSTQSDNDWYSLLRETQGDPAATLSAGFYVDGYEFGYDSLFCEWGYVIDLDRKVVEVYKGFQKSPPTRGRWAGERDPDRSGYYAVELIEEISFAHLKDEPHWMTDLEERLYAEDED